MASCLYCNRWILFGGERLNGRHYCSNKCLDEHYGGYLEDHLDPELVEQTLAEVIAQGCPGCGHKRVDARWISRFDTSAGYGSAAESKRLLRSCWRCAFTELRRAAWANFWPTPSSRYDKGIKAHVTSRNWTSLWTRNRRRPSPLLREWVVRDLCQRHQIVVEKSEKRDRKWLQCLYAAASLIGSTSGR